MSGPLFKDGELKRSKLRFKNQPSCLTVNMNVPMPFLHCLSLVPFPSDAQIEDDRSSSICHITKQKLYIVK